MHKYVLDIKNLTITADTCQGPSCIVQDVGFEVAVRERVAIVGESGCGKTMTAMSILGLLPSNCRAQGRIFLDGENLLELDDRQMNRLRGKELVLIPQNGSEFLNPVFTVRFQLYETLRMNGVEGKQQLANTAEKLLYRVGFEDPSSVLRKYPFQLSGGMAQRVILAIGLASLPRVVIADEPTRGVDEENANLFLEQMNSAFSDSAVIIITHNISMARQCAKILVMYAGVIMEYGAVAQIIEKPVHPYTKSLICALPINGFDVFQASTDVPELDGEQAGCPFYRRCPISQLKCLHTMPSLEMKGGVYRRCHYA